MSETGIDYTKYPYKISELKWVNWDGLFFNISFLKSLDQEEKANYEKIVNDWYEKITRDVNSDKTPHFLSKFTWSSNSRELSFWVDFGNAENTVLENLLGKFSKFSGEIKELLIGRNPPQKSYPKGKILMPLENIGIDPQRYPFRIFALWQYTSTTPFTISFVKQLNEEEKRQIEAIIYDYFTKDKEDVDETKYFLGVKWADSQTVGWWTEGFPLNPTTLNPLLKRFIPHQDIIDKLIIGVYLNYEQLEKYIS